MLLFRPSTGTPKQTFLDKTKHQSRTLVTQTCVWEQNINTLLEVACRKRKLSQWLWGEGSSRSPCQDKQGLSLASKKSTNIDFLNPEPVQRVGGLPCCGVGVKRLVPSLAKQENFYHLDIPGILLWISQLPEGVWRVCTKKARVHILARAPE